jgi:hypothetical protein
MKHCISIMAVIALTACGVETASTAATAGAVKRQEIEQGQKTMNQAQQKINQSMGEMQRRPENLEK